jgi:hypothetical protein
VSEWREERVVGDDAGDVRLLGLKDVAKLLGTDWRNVRRMVESGELPSVLVVESGEPRLSLRMLREWQRRRAELAAEVSNQVSNPARPTYPRSAPTTPKTRLPLERRVVVR